MIQSTARHLDHPRRISLVRATIQLQASSVARRFAFALLCSLPFDPSSSRAAAGSPAPCSEERPSAPSLQPAAARVCGSCSGAERGPSLEPPLCLKTNFPTQAAQLRPPGDSSLPLPAAKSPLLAVRLLSARLQTRAPLAAASLPLLSGGQGRAEPALSSASPRALVLGWPWEHSRSRPAALPFTRTPSPLHWPWGKAGDAGCWSARRCPR